MITKSVTNKVALLTAISSVVFIAAFCVTAVLSYTAKAVFNTDDVNPREYPNTSKSSEKTPSASPSPSISISPNTPISTQPEYSSTSNGSATSTSSSNSAVSESNNQASTDWTPWLLGGGAALVLALVGALVWRKAKKN